MIKQKPFDAVDWHGKHLHITQDIMGNVTISRHPFETIFNNEEMREIYQFVKEYL